MKIVTKAELQDLLDTATEARVVFAEYSPHIYLSDVMVAERDFGATDIVPLDGETFCWDWNIGLPDDLLSFITDKDKKVDKYE